MNMRGGESLSRESLNSPYQSVRWPESSCELTLSLQLGKSRTQMTDPREESAEGTNVTGFTYAYIRLIPRGWINTVPVKWLTITVASRAFRFGPVCKIEATNDSRPFVRNQYARLLVPALERVSKIVN